MGVIVGLLMVMLVSIGGVVGGTGYIVKDEEGVHGDKNLSPKYFEVNSNEKVSLFMKDVLKVTVNYSLPCGQSDEYYDVTLTSTNKNVFEILDNASFLVLCSNSHTTKTNLSIQGNLSSGVKYFELTQGYLEVSAKGNLLGLAYLNVSAIQNGSNDVIIQEQFHIYVLRALRLVDMAFRYLVAALFFVLFIGFGCKLDLEVVKECLKKPIAPGIGLACQYIMMPLIGYGVATIMPIEDKSIRLGIFLCGVCPGGGISNIYTLLLGGDVSMSITMTFISTIASIAFMPLWVYTLGRTLMDEGINLTIPFVPLIQAIALATVPVLIGVLIKHKFKKAAKIILKILKPVTAVFVVLLFVLGIFSNLYLFKLFKPVDFLAGCLLPYIGFLLGGVIATIFRQSWTRIKTISIEAGMQNIGIAFILLITAFPPPFGDIASIAPAANGIMTPIPGLLIAIPYNIYRKCYTQYQAVETNESEKQGNINPKRDKDKVEVEKLSSV